MIFSRVLSLFAFLFTFSLISTAKPVVAEGSVSKRADADIADVAAVFETLKAATDSILPQIDALANSGNTNTASYTALFNQLTGSVNTADVSLEDLKGKPGSGKPGPSKNELAILIAGIIIAIVKTVSNVLIKVGLFLPTLSFLIATLDIALNKILLGVEVLVAGVLVLVSGLVFDVVGLLGSLGFSLVFALLKLH